MGWASALPKAAPRGKIHQNWRPEFTPAQVDWDHLVSLDFETYYDDEYTLKKLTTSEYVRDPRFQATMCGVKVGRKKTQVIRGDRLKEFFATIDWSKHDLLCHHTHFDGLIMSHHYGVVPRKYYCSLSMARAWLSNDVAAGLDAVSKHFGRGGKVGAGEALEAIKGMRLEQIPKKLYDNAAVYCGGDIEEMLFVFLQLLPEFSQEEIDLIDATVQMFTCPVLRLDEKRARLAVDKEIKERDELIMSVAPKDIVFDTMESSWRKEVRDLYGDQFTQDHVRLVAGRKILGSGPRLAALLEAEGVEVPLKISPTWLRKPPGERDESKMYTYAFAKDDPGMQELLDDENPFVRALCEARIAVKSNTNITRGERLLRSGAGGRAMPVYYKFAGAHTWRFSGGDKQNWQNFRRGGELRLSILAPAGYVLAVADSSQIEARVNAWLWDQDDLIEAFRLGQDIYSLFATQNIYGYEVTRAEKTKKERHVGKTAILGLGYQMGWKKFRATLARGVGGPAVHISEEMAQSIVYAYRARYSSIANGWNICNQIIEDMYVGRQGEYKCLRWEKETVWLPNGMRLKYPGLRKNDEGEWVYFRKGNRIKIYGGLLCENIVQALARIIVAADQLLTISRVYPVVMTTHDEVVACVPKKEGKRALEFMIKTMSTPPVWAPGLPVAAEGGYAENYSK